MTCRISSSCRPMFAGDVSCLSRYSMNALAARQSSPIAPCHAFIALVRGDASATLSFAAKSEYGFLPVFPHFTQLRAVSAAIPASRAASTSLLPFDTWFKILTSISEVSLHAGITASLYPFAYAVKKTYLFWLKTLSFRRGVKYFADNVDRLIGWVHNSSIANKTHLCCIKKGVVLDTWDCRESIARKVWTKGKS